MRSSFLCLVLFVLISSDMANGQVSPKETPQVLEKLFDRLVNIYNDSARISINDSIRMIIGKYAKSDTVFTSRFTNLRYLGQITSPDSLLKILTWNLVLENEPGRYYCYFIRKEGQGKENKVYSLTTAYKDKPVMTDTTYTRSDWYGALYYDLKSYVTDNKQCWIMLGLDYGNPEISKKIIEVLSFTPNDSIVFGRKWFSPGEGVKYRAIFEYASNAAMSLKFKSDSSIVFDHLVPFSPSKKDDRQFYGPDYSIDAYNLKDGMWKLVLNVDERNQ
jgi:hypothetical protein